MHSQSSSTERQKRSQNLVPVLVIRSWNSLVFSRRFITSTGFYRCCAPGASVPVVVKNQSPRDVEIAFLAHVLEGPHPGPVANFQLLDHGGPDEPPKCNPQLSMDHMTGKKRSQERKSSAKSEFCHRLGIPPTSYRSQKLPRLEKSKKESPVRGSPGVPADAPKKSQKRVSERLEVENRLSFDSGDSFLTLYGASAGTPRRLSRRLFCFSSRGCFRLL